MHQGMIKSCIVQEISSVISAADCLVLSDEMERGLSTTERERHSTRGDFYGTKGNHLYPYQLAIRQSNSEPLRINH
ncbi:hypothetical protein GQ55_2G039900 [Panicum hallii var. hallii]|uniref:Uncharacterized protein n=2 Tax=Panicum hallii TaxID=206008 RepID=A0A2T7EL82_9POAL|nr:hypothetical protein GQ55_2G039900 [Panicum hallii var. hallii]PVH63485.1 hypothetical protein PAHAL_2G041100 [Panicum hallii]